MVLTTLARIKWAVVLGLTFATALYAAAYGAATLRWLLFAATSGDWLNDWLTHMPAGLQELVVAIIRGG